MSRENTSVPRLLEQWSSCLAALWNYLGNYLEKIMRWHQCAVRVGTARLVIKKQDKDTRLGSENKMEGGPALH